MGSLQSVGTEGGEQTGADAPAACHAEVQTDVAPVPVGEPSVLKPGPRPAPQHHGPSTVKTAAWGGVLEDKSRPWKADDARTVDVEARVARSDRRRAQRRINDVDGELVYFLKVEALLKPRNPTLMQVLVGKAKRFLEKFDCSDMTHERRYQLIAAAVKSAMIIDSVEDGIRQCLKNEEQDELRAKSAAFVKGGNVGHSGPRIPFFGRDSKLAP